jgi:plastocyanin
VAPMKHALMVAVVALGAFAGCGSDSSDSGEDGHAHGDEPGIVPDSARRIAIDGTSFRFDPETITVGSGDEIAVALTSADIEHDFVIDELDTHVSAGPATTSEVLLDTTHPGTYTYYCSVDGHREAGMVGTLVVE